MPEQTPTIFTIGHSNHSIEAFLGLLKQHGIACVADVRSQPYGRLEHFNREYLAAELKTAGIQYVFMGKELGARRGEKECYQDNLAHYARIARLPAFQQGLSRLHGDAQVRRVAIMCAEKEPLDCHRTILICRHLREFRVRIEHILADGRLEDHAAAEKRLVAKMGITRMLEPNLTDAEIVDLAYDYRAQDIAFHPRDEEISP
jgi:uncharacterized protein (DUF488 family)